MRETLLTKRGVIVALIASTAVLGAGFGFLPGLLGDGDDPGPVPPTDADSLPGDGTTEAVREEEDDETTARTPTTDSPRETTGPPTTTEANVASSTTDAFDVTVTPTTSDVSAEADAEMEVNVTVGSRPTIPSAVAG